jgi:hypothetical protein
MPRGDKSRVPDKKQRKGVNFAPGYEAQGLSEKEAERRAWVTAGKNAGGKQYGSGYGKSAHGGSQRGGHRSLLGSGHGHHH